MICYAIWRDMDVRCYEKVANIPSILIGKLVPSRLSQDTVKSRQYWSRRYARIAKSPSLNLPYRSLSR
jgi:hypothetical protein